MAAFSGKSGTAAIGSLVILASSTEISETSEAVEITNDNSSGKAEYVVGIEGWSATVSGLCNNSTAPTKPTGLVTVSFGDGSFTRTGTGIVTELRKGRSVRGAVTLDVTIQGTATLT